MTIVQQLIAAWPCWVPILLVAGLACNIAGNLIAERIRGRK